MSGKKTTLGIIGAGNIGSNVASAALRHGYQVVISNSRGPETLADLVAALGDGARAATAAEAATAGDIVLVATPLKNYLDVPVKPLHGKVVVDANNYYPQRDGTIPELDDGSITSSELLQKHLPDSRVVKAFNNIMAADIPTTGSPVGTAHRRALPVAGDDAEAKALVAKLLDDFGFDVVDLGPLSEGWRVQPNTPAYVVSSTAEELRVRASEAKRKHER